MTNGELAPIQIFTPNLNSASDLVLWPLSGGRVSVATLISSQLYPTSLVSKLSEEGVEDMIALVTKQKMQSSKTRKDPLDASLLYLE